MINYNLQNSIHLEVKIKLKKYIQYFKNTITF